jgi:capsule polysaccharide export protein KpsE/RkpR
MVEERLTTATVKIEPSPNNAEILLEVESRAAIEWGVGKLRLVWNRRRFVWKSVLTGLGIGTLTAFLLPAQYESYTRLMPPDDQSGRGLAMLTALTAKAGAGMAGVAGDMLGLKTTGALFVGILGSRSVQDKLIAEFDLQKIYRDSRLENARLDLTKHTAIVEDRKSGIITVTVTDRSAQRARAMANSYVNELNRVVNELSTSSAHREREFLEQRLVAVKQDLESAEKDFSQFSSKNGAIDIKEQGKAMVEAAAILQGQLIAAESELQGLKQIYTDNNVRVRGAEARITELQHQLEKLGGRGESAGSPDSQSYYPSIRRLPLLGVAYADLYRETKVQEAIFETLTQEYELAKVQEAKEVPSVKVLDAASIPESKSFPPRLLIIGCTAFLFGWLGAGWVLGTAMWQNMNPRDPRKLFAEEVLVTVMERMPMLSTNGSGSTHKVRFLPRMHRDRN